MNILCKYLSGSHLYGWARPDSDKDYRGIFLNWLVSGDDSFHQRWNKEVIKKFEGNKKILELTKELFNNSLTK